MRHQWMIHFIQYSRAVLTYWFAFCSWQYCQSERKTVYMYTQVKMYNVWMYPIHYPSNIKYTILVQKNKNIKYQTIYPMLQNTTTAKGNYVFILYTWSTHTHTCIHIISNTRWFFIIYIYNWKAAKCAGVSLNTFSENAHVHHRVARGKTFTYTYLFRTYAP